MDEPKILGKFNFVSYKPDLFDMFFIPFYGAAAMIIARNLTRSTMEKLKEDLNGSLADAREDIKFELSDTDERDV